MQSMHTVVSRIIRAMGTPLSHEAVKLLDKGDYINLVGLTASPRDYTSAEAYRLDAQVVATFRKLEGLPTGVNLEQKAVDSFFACEKFCQQTNDRLSQYNNWFERGFYGDVRDEQLFLHLSHVRRMIGDILGKIPSDLVPRFSGGSTFFDRGEEITIPHKVSSRPSVTPQAWAVVRDLFRHTAWDRALDFDPCFVNGNRFTSVPKDSTKNRGICVEPSLNVSYQLHVGSIIRTGLLGAGIDIKGSRTGIDAQTKHRSAALQASIDGLTATIDLSNASDMISYMLVKLLLPKGWFDLLSALRSPYTYIEGKWHKNHKFSSMGCGFTFELETLIFWALTQSVSDQPVSTYGDDILISTIDSGAAISLLNLLGFQVNIAKSFCDPNMLFRESCGGDYFKGQDVRPVFLKVIPSNPAEWIVLANQIHKIRSGNVGAEREPLNEAWSFCVNKIPRQYRMFGPLWAGDMVIHNEDRRSWRTRSHSCDDGQDTGYKDLKTLCILPKRIPLNRFRASVQLASALLGVPSTGPVPRDGILGYKTEWRPTVM